MDVLSHACRCRGEELGRGVVLLSLLVSMLVGAGCASARAKVQPVTVPDIVSMSQQGVAPDQIIGRIKASGTVYRLKASQLSDLQKQGVPSAVIDYMQQTYLDAVARDAAYQEWRHWTPFDDYWYGGAPFGWPYDPVYVIREAPRPARERGEMRRPEGSRPPAEPPREEPPHAEPRGHR